MFEFDQESTVTPLSCNVKHIFHSECIEQWFKTKNECPLCREEITPAGLKEFSKNIEIELQKLSQNRSAVNSDKESTTGKNNTNKLQQDSSVFL